MTKPMKIVALYNEKGGVGSTSLAAALLDAEVQSWPSPRIQGLAEEGLLDGMRDGADPGRDREIQRALSDLADAMWDRAGVSPRARR